MFEQFSEAQEKSLSKLNALSAISTTALTKFAELNKAAIQETSVKATQAGAKFSNLGDFSNISKSINLADFDEAKNYLSATVEITNQATSDTAKILDETINESNELVSRNIETLEKSSFPGANLTASAIKTLVAYANQTYDTLSTTTNYTREMINTSFAHDTKAKRTQKKK